LCVYIPQCSLYLCVYLPRRSFFLENSDTIGVSIVGEPGRLSTYISATDLPTFIIILLLYTYRGDNANSPQKVIIDSSSVSVSRLQLQRSRDLCAQDASSSSRRLESCTIVRGNYFDSIIYTRFKYISKSIKTVLRIFHSAQYDENSFHRHYFWRK